MSWARLLKRVFDIEQCPRCGGALKLIAAILEPTVIAKILAHLGLPGDRPDHRHGHSIYSKWPDPKPTPPTIRFGEY